MADGRLLCDVDAQLLEETVAALLGGQVSPAFFVPSRDEAVLIVERLRSARIESRCECEQRDCRTYRFVVAEKARDVGFLNLRLIARGEMRLVLDSDGDIHKLERLYDPERDEAMTVYARASDDEWVRFDV